jgi:aminopeptidase YwaD
LKDKLTQLVKNELSGELAKSYVTQITRFHRIQASTMFHEAAEYVRDTLRDIGIDDARIEQFTSDGRTEYWTHTSPVGWEATSAELRLVEPDERLITTYKDVPTCLHTHSRSTSPEGVTAELVDVGEGTKPEHYAGKSVKGKFVLATGRAKLVHEQAVYKYGAAGVITDTLTHEMKGVRESVDIPDAHAYQAIWPTEQDVDKVTFGFSLSKRQGNHLRALLEDGKSVRLNAKVEARLFPSTLDIVTATIKGSSKPDEEVFLVAHLCHPKPSANDNASGSGLLLEIARTMHKLIGSGDVEIGRTVRFLWVPETFGTVAYLHRHKASASRLVAGVNLDMVGQNQELCRSTLNVDKTPDSNPSYLNDYVFSLVQQSVETFDPKTAFGSASTFRYSINAFSGGSDHAEFNNSSFRIPCIMLLQWPDLYYHSSMDTVDKVSEDSLRRVGWIATVAILTLANASTDEANFLANLTRLGAMDRLGEASREALNTLFQWKGDSTPEAARELANIAFQFRNKVKHIVWREKEAVDSVKELASSLELEERITRYKADIERSGQTEMRHFDDVVTYIAEGKDIVLPLQSEESEAAGRARRLIPKRLFKGTLSSDAFKRRLGEKDYRWYEEIGRQDKDFRKKTYEIVNFIDGKRSVLEITRAVAAEYGETELDHVVHFIQDLESAKFIALQ